MVRRSVLNRSFSTREKWLLLILALVLVAGAYYYLVVKNVTDTLIANQQQLEELQIQIDEQSSIALARGRMEAELAELGDGESLPEVAVYDNIRNELNELDALMATAASYDLTFDQPELDGSLVRRTVSVSFTVSDYRAALDVVKALENGTYKCLIENFALNGKLRADGSVESVSATMDVTYLESTNGSTNLGGLAQEETS